MVNTIKTLILAVSVGLGITSWLTQAFNLLSPEIYNTLSLVGAVLGVAFIGHSAVRTLLGGVFGIDLLATVAILTSILLGENLAAIVVVLMLGGGEILEEFISGRASKAIEDLIDAFPVTALMLRDGEEVEVPVSELKPGDVVVVKPGGMIPVDGDVISGNATVNQSSVTGESLPVEKQLGDDVFSGSIVELGAIQVRIRVVGAESTYGRIISMVREAEENQAPIVRLADRFAGYYIPIILVLGIAVYWFTRDPIRMASVFIISCPCALTLATPMAVAASIGNSARKGILIRNGASLQKLADIDTVILDKTGTLTLGRPKVTDVKGFNGVSDKVVLALASGAERHSEHPVAQAILKKAQSEGVQSVECSDVETHPGMGICVTHAETRVTVGNEKLLKQLGITITDEVKEYLSNQLTNQSTVLVAKDMELIGALTVSDVLRENVREIISDARRSGAKKIVILTGDKQEVADEVAERAGVDEVVADLLPAEKVTHVKQLKEAGGKVMMVGDGINDAPSLATADVGIAMGLTGTDIAIETAGITLSNNNLEGVPKLLRIGRETMKIVKLNIAFALIVNAIGIILSSTGQVSPLIASIIHEGNALIVMLNSLRLLRID
ncbi:cation-translocating P-type ATPase [Candidatus Bathyarchaeota archaeon]|nr:cation-translocating P-type ATPase [Candidatus Bathyarchaeota archaeon]